MSYRKKSLFLKDVTFENEKIIREILPEWKLDKMKMMRLVFKKKNLGIENFELFRLGATEQK